MSDFPTLGVVGGPDFNPRTMSQAATAAESAAFASSLGRRIKCNRGRGWMTTAECVANFQAGQDDSGSQPVCSRDLGCSAGRMRAANFKEDDMGKYGKCKLCGVKGSLDSLGRCYHAKCKAARLVKSAKPESTILGQDEFEALGEGLGTGMGQGDIPPNGQNFQRYSPDVLASLAADMLQERVGGVLNDAVAPGLDHISQPGKMVGGPGLDDPAAPFTLAGIAFEPLRKLRVPGENRVSVRKSSIGISAAADQEHNLSRYTHARYTVSVDGKALAIKCLAGPKGDAVKIERNTGGVSISAVPLARKYPHLVGQRAALEATELAGRFVVRLNGEAA